MIREDITGWASFVAIILSIGSLIWGWLTSGGAKALVETRSLRDEMRSLDVRVIRLENELPHLPSREQTHALQLSLLELKGDIGKLDERLKPVAAISDRLQDFLITQTAR